MERLIEAVRLNPCVWDISSKEYRNADKKELAWHSIVKYLNSPDLKDVKEAKAEWKKLRDCHRDSLKRMKSKSGPPGSIKNNWRYAKMMEFLLPYMKNRRSRRFINLNPEDTLLPETSTSIEQEDENSNSSDASEPLINNVESSVSQGCRINVRKRNADGEYVELLKEVDQKQIRQEDKDLRPTNTTQEKNAIDLFLESMAITIKAMPTWMQSRIKKKIFLIVSDAEEELENNQTSVAPDSVAAGSSRRSTTTDTCAIETVYQMMPAKFEPDYDE